MSAPPKVVAAVVALAVLGGLPAYAQTPIEDPERIVRLLDQRTGPSYELTSEFKGALTLWLGDGRYVVAAWGQVRESRRAGEARKVDATVLKIHLPLLLRPAAGSVASVIEQLIETQAEDARNLTSHDVVLLEKRRDGRFYLGGIRHDIVDEAIARYRAGVDAEDPFVRRAIARWLLTTPSMRQWIRRSGPPYAFGALIDEAGHLFESAVSYDWGEVGNKVSYTSVQDIAAWQQLTLNVTGQVKGLGQVTGRLEMSFSDHRLTR